MLENQYAPPGYFAPAAPKPSKAAVMIFYVSVAFCIIGCIMLIKGVLKPNLKVRTYRAGLHFHSLVVRTLLLLFLITCA